MDDTPARMKARDPERPDRRTDDVAGRQDETMRGYGGEAVSPSPPTGTAASIPADAARDRSHRSSDEHDPDTRQIRADIERTREDMAETIDAIQEKLRPGSLIAGAGDRVRSSAASTMRSLAESAGEGAQAMMQQTRGRTGSFTGRAGQNPVPIALIGIGVAWFLWNRSRPGRRRHQHVDRDWPGRYREAVGYEAFNDRVDVGGDPYLASEYRSDAGSFGEGSYGAYEETGWGSDLMRRVAAHPVPAALTCAGLAWLVFSDTDDEDERLYATGAVGVEPHRSEWNASQEGSSAAARARESIGGAATRAPEATREMADRAGRYARGATRRVRGGGRRAQNQIQRLLRRNPLLAGAGAFVLGASVGLLIPESERENEWMGEARDRMLDRAQEKARDAARNVASRAKEAAGQAVGRIASETAPGGDSGSTNAGSTSGSTTSGTGTSGGTTAGTRHT